MLTQDQVEAVRFESGTRLCLSVPGSGKTSVICSRVAHLVRAGEPVSKIQCLTFTRSAALNMAERINKKTSIPLKVLARRICTYHALGYRILIRHGPWGKLDVLLGAKREAAISKHLGPGINYKDASRYISSRKRGLARPGLASGCFDRALDKVYAAYQNDLDSSFKADFDDLIMKPCLLLQADPAIRNYYQYRTQHLLVDEFQDTTPAQQRLTELLAKRSASCLFVGDVCQSIFGFAGADCSAILNLGKTFPGYSTMFLRTNFRSTRRVVDFFRGAAPRGLGEKVDELVRIMDTPPEALDGVPPRLGVFGGPEEEAAWVVRDIQRVASCGLAHSQIAVLFRTNRQSRAFEVECAESGVPYVSSSASFFSRPEVMAALCLAKASLDENAMIDGQWCGLRLLSAKVLGCRVYAGADVRRASSMDEAVCLARTPGPRAAIDRLKARLRAVSEMRARHAGSPGLFFRHMCEGVLWELFGGDGLEDGDNLARENAQEIERAASRFGSVASFIAHAEEMMHAQSSKGCAVTLSTIHKAKGREWSQVYVCGVSEGVLPHASGDPAEEERVLYVGLSRAKEHLCVTGFMGSSGRLPKFFVERGYRA